MGRPPKEVDQSTYAGRFAARLRTLREKKGLTGEQMAQAITEAGYACSKATWLSWESNRREPPLGVLPILSQVFEIPIRTIFPKQ